MVDPVLGKVVTLCWFWCSGEDKKGEAWNIAWFWEGLVGGVGAL